MGYFFRLNLESPIFFSKQNVSKNYVFEKIPKWPVNFYMFFFPKIGLTKCRNHFELDSNDKQRGRSSSSDSHFKFSKTSSHVFTLR